MGFTLRAGILKPNEVRKAVDNYETNSLDDNILLNGKYVKDRKKRREYRRDLAQRKRESKDATMTKEAPKQASFVDNNEQIKQAALLKLATLRLSINYVLRNRGLNKQAASNKVSPLGPVLYDPSTGNGRHNSVHTAIHYPAPEKINPLYYLKQLRWYPKKDQATVDAVKETQEIQDRIDRMTQGLDPHRYDASKGPHK